ncbi:MAG TPA: hypothetical protein VNX87_06940, partial [Candidatus Sulfotelmatobacter sp.]|nr:hypothetical protein [Candidatus Sulfotelmatobacter sp.]
RHHLPAVQIRVRLDGGFAHPAVLEFLDAQPRLEYVVAMAKNAVLKRVNYWTDDVEHADPFV